MSIIQSGHAAIVDSNTGSKVANSDKPFILALKSGENLFESILRCADAANIKSASISGLGGLFDISVAYYHLEAKQYQTKVFTGMYELISMNGNIAFFEGKRFLHIHAALGAEDYHVYGGHLMDATVNPSAEITIIPLPDVIKREHDSQSGLKLMCPILAER